MQRYLALPSAFLLGALALPAPAQTSGVTIGGLVDAGAYRDYDKTGKVGTIQRSNLAFSGREDLGGGLAATFKLSTRFEMGSGANEGQGSKPFWQDESTVGLQGAWGQLRAGRALSAMWAHDWTYDPWANFNRIASQAWYFWHYLTPTDRVSNNGSGEYGRMANGIFYDAPAIGGFTLHLSVSPERTAAPGANGRARSASLNYKGGPVQTMVAHERNGSGDRNSFAAARYDWGAFALMGAYDRSQTADAAQKARAATLGATYTAGAVTFKAGLGRQRLNRLSNRMASLGADYAFSRRTTVYASLGHQRYEGTASRSAFGMGIAHTF